VPGLWTAKLTGIALFALNLLLLARSFYDLTLALQTASYALALAGCLWQRKGKPPRIPGIPFSFCLVYLAALVGAARFVMGKKAGAW